MVRRRARRGAHPAALPAAADPAMDIWWLLSWANHRRAPRSASSDRVDQQSERHFAGQGSMGARARGPAPANSPTTGPARRTGSRAPRPTRLPRGPRCTSTADIRMAQRRRHRIRCDAGKLAIVRNTPTTKRQRHLFYHDHAMSVTTLNVMSGLVGNYVIRDDEEDRLDLPRGALRSPVDHRRRQLRHRFGRPAHRSSARPNASWPGAAPRPDDPAIHSMLRPVHHGQRGRVATFRGGVTQLPLSRRQRLAEPGLPARRHRRCDRRPVAWRDDPHRHGSGTARHTGPIETLSLSAAERADVVVDFGGYPGQRLKLVNTVAGQPAGAAVPAANIPHPEVMEFRIAERRQPTQRIPAKLSRDFRRLTVADVPSDAVERFVLTAYDKSGVMPQLWEMQDVGHGVRPGDGIVQVAMPRWPANLAPCRHGIRRHHHLLCGRRHLGEVDTSSMW